MSPHRIFHFSVKPVRRSLAKSAAYILGIALRDVRNSIVSNFSRRGAGDRDEIVLGDLLLPGGRIEDVGLFVNRVMRRNKKPRAVFGRAITAAIPACMTEAEMCRYVRLYAEYLVARYGVGVIVAIHRPSAKRRETSDTLRDDAVPERALNWHVHFLLSYCTVDEHGVLGNKQRLLDPTDCIQMRVQNFCDVERPRWEKATNDALQLSGSAVRVDHRTLADQGSMDLPSRYRGPSASSSLTRSATKIVGSGDQEVKVLAHNRYVRERNAKRRELVQGSTIRLLRRRDHKSRMSDLIDRLIDIETTRVARSATVLLALPELFASAPETMDIVISGSSRASSNRWWQAILGECRRPEVEAFDRHLGIVLFTDGGAIAKIGRDIMQVDTGEDGYADDLVSDIRYHMSMSEVPEDLYLGDPRPQVNRDQATMVKRNGAPFTDDRIREIKAQFVMLRPRNGNRLFDELKEAQLEPTGITVRKRSPR